MEVVDLSPTSCPLSPLLSTAPARRLRLLPPRCVFGLHASPRTRGTFLLIRLARRLPVRIHPFVLSISEVALTCNVGPMMLWQDSAALEVVSAEGILFVRTDSSQQAVRQV
jgi:hypothetical protein